MDTIETVPFASWKNKESMSRSGSRLIFVLVILFESFTVSFSYVKKR